VARVVAGALLRWFLPAFCRLQQSWRHRNSRAFRKQHGLVYYDDKRRQLRIASTSRAIRICVELLLYNCREWWSFRQRRNGRQHAFAGARAAVWYFR
jgi:hypothetical protein